MKAMKFKVRNPEHSEAIQKRLFEMGYKWLSIGKVIIQTGLKHLYTDTDGDITWGG